MNIAGHSYQANGESPSSQPADQPAVAMLAFGRALPAYCAAQADIGEWMASSLGSPSAIGRLLHSLHNNSDIDTRYSCCADYLQPAKESRFAPGQPLANAPTTAERMAIYTKEAPPLGTAAACDAVESYAQKCGTTPAELLDSITHLIVVSCTGFFAPGLDFVIARELKLKPTVHRSLIGFMGCSAAFNGLRSAYEIVRSQPTARVLLVSVELCSLHVQPNPTREQLIAYALFSDGAAACLIGQPQPEDKDFFQLEGFHTSTKPDTESEMVWAIGDHGFTLKLSPKVPHHLAEIAPTAVAAMFGDDQPQFWAIHPGGRAIVDQLAELFGLAPEQVAASRKVLRQYGNLSSATILFVLDELQRTLYQVSQQAVGTQTNGHAEGHLNGHRYGAMSGGSHDSPQAPIGVAMAFGPGLVIEMARLRYVAMPSLAHTRQTLTALGVATG